MNLGLNAYKILICLTFILTSMFLLINKLALLDFSVSFVYFSCVLLWRHTLLTIIFILGEFLVLTLDCHYILTQNRHQNAVYDINRKPLAVQNSKNNYVAPATEKPMNTGHLKLCLGLSAATHPSTQPLCPSLTLKNTLHVVNSLPINFYH